MNYYYVILIEDNDKMDSEYLSKLSINTNDPRQCNEFLWLRYNINSINLGSLEKIYWMALEKRCLSLFQKKGYDLQTGAWYCMIAAQLYSWDGVANASWKFAECIIKEKNCWPPASTNQLRAQVLGWYINHVIPVINLLPKEEQTFSSLCLLEDSLMLLSEMEYVLFLDSSSIVKNFLFDLRCHNKFNKKASTVIVSQLDMSVPSLKGKSTVKQSKSLITSKGIKKTYGYYLLFIIYLCLWLLELIFFFNLKT